jgi:chromosome segregation protein
MRLELAPLTLDLDGVADGADRASRLVEELKEVSNGLDRARKGLDRAGSEVPEKERLSGLADVHAGAGHAIDHARRAESLLGERHRERLGESLERVESLIGVIRDLIGAGTAASEALGARVARSEASVVGDGEDADEIARELKACSDEEVEIQAGLRMIAEKVTTAEVEAAHLEDRRAEAVGELERIATRTGDPTPEPEEPMAEEERTTVERRIESLRTRREKLGPVNPLAQREYEEAQEHLSALVEQREDTERALRELESVIRDIDEEITRSFDQTFEATAANFEEMIGKLFPGGSGRLGKVELTPPPGSEGGEAEASDGDDLDDEDLDRDPDGRDFGVELEVTPKGKRTRQMKLLSGGEKALTALAFVFAVFLARPCPFYILDEVEAALDDANISRFLDLVSEFSNRTQFIIVTHQKLTMDAADVLYGVSMGGDGITRVVSRRLPRAADQAAQGSGLSEAA